MLRRTLPFWLAATVVFASPKPNASDLLAKLPLHFEPLSASFITRAPGYTVQLQSGGVLFNLRNSQVRLSLPPSAISPFEKTDAISNYIHGNHPQSWRTKVPHYGRIRYSSIYPGIDVDFYGNARQLEYDFLVAPGANPASIQIRVSGAESLRITSQGNLEISTTSGPLVLQAPVAYQFINGRRKQVESRFRLHKHAVSFALGGYDRTKPLTIDPIVSFATYLGGNSTDVATAITVDALSNVYVAGYTLSNNFPSAANVYRNTFSGGNEEIFISKLSPQGNRLIYSTFLGGTGDDRPVGISVDGFGNVTVAGNTFSLDFPVFNANLQSALGVMFLSRISADGSQLVNSTYFGGTAETGAGRLNAYSVDPNGNIYLAGVTSSSDFATTSGVFQGTIRGDNDGFAAKISPNLSSLLYSTFLGGSAFDQINSVTADAAGNAYVTGQTLSTNFPTVAGSLISANRGGNDVFVARLNPTASALDFSAILGGSSDDYGRAITLGPGGNIYIAGLTLSSNYNTTPGAFQFLRPAQSPTSGFLTKLNPSASALIYSTYLGGSVSYYDMQGVVKLATDASDNVYIAGYGQGNGLPVTPGALQSPAPGLRDVFVCRLNSAGDILSYSTFFGGSGEDSLYAAAQDASGNLYLAGSTTSTNLPVTTGAVQANYQTSTDAFLAKIDFQASAINCNYALSVATFTIDSLGGAATFDVTAAAGCTWTASSNQTWATVTSGAQGTGNGTVAFTIEPNTTTANRTAVITAAGSRFTITQSAAPCSYTIDPGNRSVPASGGIINFVLLTLPTCTWTAVSNNSWLRLAGLGSGAGSNQVPVLFEENTTGIPRTGSLTIAKQGIHLIQPAAAPILAFEDVALSHPFADHIFLFKNNRVSDYCNNNPNTFCPEGLTTRAQMSVYIIRGLNPDNPDGFTYSSRPYFTDVPPEHPQFPYIQKMRDLGITSGCTATEYCPQANITRGQMSAFIIRAKLKIKATDKFTFNNTPLFTDVPSSDLFFSYIQKMKEFGITSGCTTSDYCPYGETTRGQMAVFVIRSLFTP